MGEEQKKPDEKKEEEAKKPDSEDVKKEEAPPAAAAATGGGASDEKPKEGGESAAAVEESAKDPPPPPPPAPQEIILRVYMHCEGCARKVRRCLKGFHGVEEVETDCKSHKVVVKGERADPLKVLERVQRKSHRQVELLSPIPKPPSKEESPPQNPEEKQVAKPDDKKEQLPVITAVLCVHMHCDACAQEIRRRIQRMKGVESVEPDLKSSQVTVKGSFDPPKLIDFIYKRTGKHASIVKVEPQEQPKEEAEAAANEENKKTEAGGEAATSAVGGGGGGGEKDAKKGGEEDGKEKGGGDSKDGGGEQQQAKEEAAAAVEGGVEVGDPKMEMRKNELYYTYPQNHQQHQQMMMMAYPQRFVQQELYAYPPQIFSDENPNACSVM